MRICRKVCRVLAISAMASLSAGAASAAEPDRGGDLAAGAPGLAVGLNALRELDQDELRAEFADYVRLGVRWLRTDLYWADVQAEGAGHFDWSEMDRLLDLTDEFGLKLLPVVGTTPKWARSDPDQGSPPTDPVDFARFMTAAVERYAPRGVHIWEIWNEPNLSGPFPPHPDPETYTALLNAAYDAIHAADDDATVILGGLSPVTWTGPPFNVKHYAAPAFLEAVYAEGGGDSFDAVGFHPYSYPDGPDAGWRWNGWGMMTGPMRDLMVRNGDADKRIWITEMGAPTNDGQGGISESEQADLLAEIGPLTRDLPWAGPLFWYSYRDQGNDPEYNEDWFGLVDGKGRQKPAWVEYKGFSEAAK